MADISKIKLPSGTTYNIKDSISGYTTNTGTITQVKTTAGAHTTIDVSSGAATFNVPTKTSHLTNDSGFITNAGVTGVKGNAEFSYRTGQVNLTAANINAYEILSFQRGTTDISIRPLISRARANRLAFLPPNQVIIEKTIDGGVTWTDAGYTDAQKIGLFATSGSIVIPLLNNAKSELCGLRVTITGMKYDVPDGTLETSKYSYWNSEHILSQERYFNVREWWFWLSSNNDTIQCEIQAATGANSTTWRNMFNTEFHMSGWSGSDWIKAGSGATFGGGTTQTGNYWNWRLIFWSRKADNKDTFQSATAQSINIIQCYGDSVWGSPNSLMSNDHLYSYDNSQNATFPAKVTATSFSGNLTGNVSGTASNVTGTVAIANGGTGQTTAANAINALLNGLPTWTADPTDTTYFIRQDTGGSATYGKVQATTLWNYISGKLPAWSKASSKPSYNFSEIGSTPTTLSGYGITDAKIASGTITLGSNTITPLTSSSTLNAAKLSGAIPSAVTATTQTAGDNSTKIATTAFVSSAISGLPTPMQFIGTVGTNGTTTWANLPAASGHNGYTYKVITAHTAETGKPAADVGDALISNGTEWIVIPAGDETATQSATTGISIAAHGTGTVIGVQSTTTTASKVTVSSSSTDYGVKSAGSASTWTFEEKTIPNVTSAGTASSWTFEEKTIPNVTSAGSASTWAFTSKTVVTGVTFAMDTTDTKKLKITTSTDTVYSKSSGSNGTAPTLGTAIKVQSKSGGSNGTAPTLGTAIKVQSKSGGANSTAPTLGSKVPTVSASDVTVPIKNASASTFVTGTTHTVTDNGHTHTI